MVYITEVLNSTHKKKLFSCGKPLLDNYLQTQAKQDVARKLSVCFVLPTETNVIKGYYTLSNASIEQHLLTEEIRKKLPPNYKNLSATLLGRLAVANEFMGNGLGELLLLDALKRSFDVSLSVASMAIIVDPIDDEAIAFYFKYGFILLPNSGKMFLAMQTVSKLF